MRALAFLLVFLLWPSVSVHALRQYHCDGMVQYRPCDEPFSREIGSGASNLSVRQRPVKKDPVNSDTPEPEPRVFDDSFEAVSRDEGIWRGKVAGKGFVQLELHILEQGKLSESRYMGGIELDGNSTFFAFKTALPRGKDWTWVIKAHL